MTTDKISSIEDILSNDYEILSYYFGKPIRLNRAIRSPFREDRHPSFAFYRKGNKTLWIDYATGEKGDVFEFVKKKLNLSSFKDVIETINNRFNYGFKAKKKISVKNINDKIKTTITIEKREFNEKDMEYWNSYSITTEVLKLFNVSAVNKLYIDKNYIYKYRVLNPAYCYSISQYNKIYFPFTKKFISNIPGYLYFGMENIPDRGDILIITKSLKDVMVLYVLGIPSISPQSETIIPEKDLIDNLCSRFKKVLLLYDNDDTGKKMSEKIANIYGLERAFTKDTKDISDLMKMKGIEFCREQIWKILKP